MRAFLTRELIVIARRPAVAVAVLANVLLLSAFVLVWAPRGVPLLQGWNLHEQARLLHSALLAVSLPWVAARAAMPEHGARLVLTSAITGRSPAEILAGRTAAMAVALACVAATGVPLLVFAQQIAAIPLLPTLPNLLPVLGACVLIAALNTAVALLVRNRLSAWIATTALSVAGCVALPRVIPGAVLGGTVAIALGLTLAAAMASRANASLLYLAEDDA